MGTSTIICLTASLAALLLTVICLIATIYALIELRSFNKSTHKIEWMPLEGGVPTVKEPMTDDILKQYDL
jgi:hypothetical protein